MERTRLHKMQVVLYAAASILAIALLCYLWFAPNIQTWQGRESEQFTAIENVSYTERADPASPTGIVRQFRFQLESIPAYDTTLIFRFSHQSAAVYLDGELVYSLRSADELSIIRTTGNNWAMIPLYREDTGREVLVELTPIYRNYQDQKISFLVGSKLAVYTAQFMKFLPEMTLSVIDALIGLILLCIAVCFSLKKVQGDGFYALALLAISLSMWNFSQTDFASLILPNKPVFLYYVSLTMLMLCIIPLVKSARALENQPRGRLQEVWCVICGVICFAQLVIQILGLLDLREMLKITHSMIVVSALVLMISSFAAWHRRPYGAARPNRVQGIWLLGVGTMIDLVIYYFCAGSSELLFVLIAILCFVVMEGVQIFSDYSRQKQMLEEKETQLTLSRITTMMSQIRSHFVFNILNAISGMCKYDPEKADETVVRFARYLRNNIDIMEDDKPVLFSTELAHLEDYVVLEQVRFGDKIEFFADVQADQFRIPPLILQPVVENAIKHGLTQKQSGGTVTLSTWEEGENIKISVADDGVGFELSELDKKHSVGLRNIRYRLNHLVHGTMEIESQVGVGTTVTITIPKKESKPCTSSM